MIICTYFRRVSEVQRLRFLEAWALSNTEGAFSVEAESFKDGEAHFALPPSSSFTDGYTTTEVEQLTGIDNGTIRSWIQKGDVEAEETQLPWRYGSEKTRKVYKVPTHEVERLLSGLLQRN
ncbi:MAG: hypothetical protein M3305_10455 [Actinomycetota bacterium]|nr:hypothetical protein [Actinomycetota bacterium]